MSATPASQSTLRASIRFVGLLLFVVVALPICTLLVVTTGVFGLRQRHKMVMALTPMFCQAVATSLGMRITIRGKRSPDAMIFVGNHVSYIDILVAGVAIGGVFVSRHDVQDWPGIGLFARLAGTVFLDRSSLRSAVESSGGVVERVQQGARITIFPEGGTSEGGSVKGFKPFLFGAVAGSKISVQPFTIHYDSIAGQPVTVANRDLVYWYDPAQAFTSHAWHLMQLPYVRASLEFHEPHPSPASNDKENIREFAEELRQAVAETVMPMQ